jgi:hypothetical protein
MKIGDYFIKESVPQKIANAKGKFSTQFMSGDLMNEKPSRKKNLEAGARMGGYEVNRKPATNRTDTQQPMACHSEFWIC